VDLKIHFKFLKNLYVNMCKYTKAKSLEVWKPSFQTNFQTKNRRKKFGGRATKLFIHLIKTKDLLIFLFLLKLYYFNKLTNK